MFARRLLLFSLRVGLVASVASAAELDWDGGSDGSGAETTQTTVASSSYTGEGKMFSNEVKEKVTNGDGEVLEDGLEVKDEDKEPSGMEDASNVSSSGGLFNGTTLGLAVAVTAAVSFILGLFVGRHNSTNGDGDKEEELGALRRNVRGGQLPKVKRFSNPLYVSAGGAGARTGSTFGSRRSMYVSFYFYFYF